MSCVHHSRALTCVSQETHVLLQTTVWLAGRSPRQLTYHQEMEVTRRCLNPGHPSLGVQRLLHGALQIGDLCAVVVLCGVTQGAEDEALGTLV